MTSLSRALRGLLRVREGFAVVALLLVVVAMVEGVVRVITTGRLADGSGHFLNALLAVVLLATVAACAWRPRTRHVRTLATVAFALTTLGLLAEVVCGVAALVVAWPSPSLLLLVLLGLVVSLGVPALVLVVLWRIRPLAAEGATPAVGLAPADADPSPVSAVDETGAEGSATHDPAWGNGDAGLVWTRAGDAASGSAPARPDPSESPHGDRGPSTG